MTRWCRSSSGCSGSLPLDVARAGEHLGAEGGQAPRHQRGVRQRSGAQGHVDLAADHVHRLVAQVHVQAHFRVACVELAQQRRDPGDADGVGRAEAQPAAGPALQLAHRALGLVQLAGDVLAVLVVHAAGLGQAQAARGAVEQLRAQARLQLLHLAAEGGLGQAERPGRGRETALFDHLDEDQGVVEIECHVGGLRWGRPGLAL